ncbi:hypothetical protein J6G99_02920 [bacterium]|nr:hypothetical protein [bacterium]
MNKFFTLVFTFVMVASPAFAKTFSPELKLMISKFTIAMSGVAAFSFLLFLILSLYNKFFVDSQVKDFNLRKDSLRSPIDKEDAIMTFITRCRLK